MTLDPPVFVRVSESVWLLPSCTVPKSRLVGFAPSAPTVVTPVPESVSMVGLVEASLVIEAVALNAPAALGLKTKLSVEFCPAAMVTGRLGPLMEK